MLLETKNKIERALPAFLRHLDKSYSLSKTSPVLFRQISDFVLRKGKRVRPLLFIVGYRGFADSDPRGLYTSALSLELLHDFMLVHDDIIDKSDTRRGKPAMHRMLNDYLSGYKIVKFSGEDLGIVAGDIMYAMGIHAFLSVDRDARHKERALKKLVEAAIYTGSGEFIELLLGLKDIAQITKEDIYKIYDLKTAYYTFAAPLGMGAALAGADDGQVNKLVKYGTYLGRAFQIKDDVLGMFSEEQKTGKSALTDLQEGKKTVLIWYGYNNSTGRDKLVIKRILSKNKVTRADLHKMRGLLTASGALDYAKKEILRLINQAQALNLSSRMSGHYKNLLDIYSRELLAL
jgi:geranylgeranyl diphosphate synthase type I